MPTHHNGLQGVSLKPNNFMHYFLVLVLVEVMVKGSLCDVYTMVRESKPTEKSYVQD